MVAYSSLTTTTTLQQRKTATTTAPAVEKEGSAPRKTEMVAPQLPSLSRKTGFVWPLLNWVVPVSFVERILNHAASSEDLQSLSYTYRPQLLPQDLHRSNLDILKKSRSRERLEEFSGSACDTRDCPMVLPLDLDLLPMDKATLLSQSQQQLQTLYPSSQYDQQRLQHQKKHHQRTCHGHGHSHAHSKGSSDRKSRKPLVSFEEAPAYMKGNRFITSHYRTEYSVSECLWSIFDLHSETLNIWTSVLGFVVNLCCFISVLFNAHELFHHPTLDRALRFSILSCPSQLSVLPSHWTKRLHLQRPWMSWIAVPTWRFD